MQMAYQMTIYHDHIPVCVLVWQFQRHSLDYEVKLGWNSCNKIALSLFSLQKTSDKKKEAYIIAARYGWLGVCKIQFCFQILHFVITLLYIHLL